MPLPIDPELRPWVPLLPVLDIGDPAAARAALAAMKAAAPEFVLPDHLVRERIDVPGPDGGPPVPVLLFRPRDSATAQPALLYAHGGGFVLGDAEGDQELPARIAAGTGAVVVSVDYRLAPEHPFPAAFDDCFAALVWLAGNAAALGVDPDRIGVAGVSAGAGLAAALALKARDTGGPALCFQLLDIPELDDRVDTPSAREFTDTPMWNRPNALHSWRHYLSASDPAAPVSPYAAPARTDDLTGLPPAHVMVCDLDPLRDEGLDYAQRLVRSGVPTELQLFPGTFHGAEGAVPDTAVTRRMRAGLIDAVRRGLAAR